MYRYNVRASATRSVTADTYPDASVVGRSTPREHPQSCGYGENHTANYHGCVKWKEATAALAKQAHAHSRKSIAAGKSAAPKAQRASPSAEQMDLGEGWNHVVRGGRVVKDATPLTNPHPNPPPQPVTGAP